MNAHGINPASLESNGHAKTDQSDASLELAAQPHRFGPLFGKYRDDANFAEVCDAIEAACRAD